MNNLDSRLEIQVGDSLQSYSGGDYLNAINEVTEHFKQFRNQDDADLVAALRLYADQMEREIGQEGAE
jgi:hypothetical protein